MMGFIILPDKCQKVIEYNTITLKTNALYYLRNKFWPQTYAPPCYFAMDLLMHCALLQRKHAHSLKDKLAKHSSATHMAQLS